MPEIITPPLSSLVPHINWSFYFAAWGVPGVYPGILDHPEKGDVARSLYTEARQLLAMMEGRIAPAGIYERRRAHADGHSIAIADGAGDVHIPTPDVGGTCAADFVEASGGWVTPFVFTAGKGVREMYDEFSVRGDEYSAFSVKFLADRLVEAFADMALPGGCRLAIGYPAIPDHAVKHVILDILDPANRLALEFTESHMIVPPETVCGLWLRRGRYL